MSHVHTGLGAFASPLVATQFAEMERWSFHFLVSLGLAVSNTVLLISVFKFKTQDGIFLSLSLGLYLLLPFDFGRSQFMFVAANRVHGPNRSSPRRGERQRRQQVPSDFEAQGCASACILCSGLRRGRGHYWRSDVPTLVLVTLLTGINLVSVQAGSSHSSNKFVEVASRLDISRPGSSGVSRSFLSDVGVNIRFTAWTMPRSYHRPGWITMGQQESEPFHSFVIALY